MTMYRVGFRTIEHKMVWVHAENRADAMSKIYSGEYDTDTVFTDNVEEEVDWMEEA